VEAEDQESQLVALFLDLARLVVGFTNEITKGIVGLGTVINLSKFFPWIEGKRIIKKEKVFPLFLLPQALQGAPYHTYYRRIMVHYTLLAQSMHSDQNSQNSC
jgi:hypothetical protein